MLKNRILSDHLMPRFLPLAAEWCHSLRLTRAEEKWLVVVLWVCACYGHSMGEGLSWSCSIHLIYIFVDYPHSVHIFLLLVLYFAYMIEVSIALVWFHSNGQLELLSLFTICVKFNTIFSWVCLHRDVIHWE